MHTMFLHNRLEINTTKHIVSLCIAVTLLAGYNSMITKGVLTEGVTPLKPESVPESFVDNEISIKQTDISLLLEGSDYHPYMDESIGDIVGKYPSNTFTLEERTQEGWDITLYRATLSRLIILTLKVTYNWIS